MRILLLDFGREFRGGQRQVLYLARRLAANGGFDPVLAAPRGELATRAADEGIETLALSGRHAWDPRVMVPLHLSFSKNPAHILHTNDAKSAALGALVKRVRGDSVRLVHTRRVSYPLRAGAQKRYCIADAVVAVSREIGEVVAAGGVARERIEVVHSGIDPAGYPTARPWPQAPVIGVIGALTAQKGHEVFLAGLGALAKSGAAGTDWSAIIVGDGPLRADLESLARSLGIWERVTFAGYVESREALAGIDVLCVPSVDGEGSSGTIKEGWVAGVPVVCSDLPSNLELVDPELSGLAFGNRDAQGLGAALERVLADRELAARIVQGGSEKAQFFTDQAMAVRYMDLYQRLLDG